MPRAIALALALALAGCNPLGAGAPQTVSILNQTTVSVKVRLGTFTPGNASVTDASVIAEGPISPRGSASFDVPPGKYALQATADTATGESAVTSIEVKAGTPRSVSLVERFKLVPRKDDKTQLENQRILGWDD